MEKYIYTEEVQDKEVPIATLLAIVEHACAALADAVAQMDVQRKEKLLRALKEEIISTFDAQ